MRVPRRVWLVPALVGLLVFVPSLWNGFAYDDVGIIETNTTLHDPANIPVLVTAPYWGTGRGAELGAWRPALMTYFSLLWWATDGAAWAFHLANVLMHAAASALVGILGAVLFSTGAGLVAGVVFAVHPVHVEAVANVVGAGELLSVVPVLWALLLALKGGEEGVPRLGVLRIGAITLLFTFGFLVKEGAVVLPGLIFLVDAARHRLRASDLPGYVRARLGLYSALLVASLAVLFARQQVLGGLTSGSSPLGADLLREIPRIWTIAPVWAEYVRLMVFPLALSPDYSPDVVPIRTMWSPEAFVGVALALGLLALAWLLARQGEEPESEGRIAPVWALPVAILWFAVAVSPTSNVLFLSGILLAERTLYLPSVAVAWALGVVWVAWAARPAARWAAAIVVLGFFSWRTVTYTRVWESTLTVMQHMMVEVPQAGRGHWVMGDLLLTRGDHDLAVREFRRAMTRLDGGKWFFLSVGSRLFEAGEADRARIFLERAVADHPDASDAKRLLAYIAAQNEDWTAAERWTRELIESAAFEGEDDLRMRDLLATVLARQGRWEEAARVREVLFDTGGRAQPSLWYLLAEAYAESGRPGQALQALDSAAARDSIPTRGDSLRAVYRARLDSL